MSEEQEKATPKWGAAPPALKQRFAEIMADLPLAERRQMFGCPCAFVGGQMFAGLFQEDMFLRLSEADRAEFMKLEGARPFEPMQGRRMREYVVVPPAFVHSAEQLGPWLERAFQYAAALPPKEKKAAGADRPRRKPAQT